jgi:hypothetical protein
LSDSNLWQYFYEGPAGTADTVTFSPDFPGQIIPVRFEDYSGGKIICQKGSLLASANTVNLSGGHIWIKSQPQARLVKRIMEAVKAES